MPTSTRARLLFLTLAAIIATLLAACSDEGPGEPETIEIPIRWASANASTLPALVASSDEVFTARVSRLAGTREETLSPRSSVPISIYEISITRVFVGGRAAGATATFEQAGGIVEQDGTSVRLMLEGDPPVEVGKEYLFFASIKDNGTLSAPPYGRLEVTANEALVPLAEWAGLGALQQLSQVPSASLSDEIDEAVQ